MRGLLYLCTLPHDREVCAAGKALSLCCSLCPFSYSAEMVLDEQLCSLLAQSRCCGPDCMVHGKAFGYQTSSCEDSLYASLSSAKSPCPRLAEKCQRTGLAATAGTQQQHKSWSL